MLFKLLLGAGFVFMLAVAFLLGPSRQRSLLGARSQEGPHLKLMSWNIGYGDLESDTRARSADLPAVAEIILSNDPDAVALQELTGADQLKLLLAHLKNRYRGSVSSFGRADRVAAVLVKDRRAHFDDVVTGERFAAAATFHPNKDLPEIVLVSAHADAFSASRRRTFAADVVDWTRGRPKGEIAFIAGDFNFEVSIRNKTNLFTDEAKHDSEAYAYLLKYFRDLGRDAGETSINDRRIDYVFGPAETVTLRRAEVLRGTAIGRMDHWPLLVEIVL
ncbi:MAG TPA: endonuclease/exonuclease/phosphatase family protein [Pyrinomonadaceae bacterium]|jgi:endonuclease/exonuclease/phosphatase family metal-dependent hydrolase